MRIRNLPSHEITNSIIRIAILAGVLALSLFMGYRASRLWPILLAASIGLFVLLRKPILGLALLIVAAISAPLKFSTGTAVVLNPVTLLVPAVFALWLLDSAPRRDLRPSASRTNRPLLLFLVSGLLSLIVGLALWDPAVPRTGNFLLVQIAQWAIFVFSAFAYWLVANMIRDEIWLRRLTFLFLTWAGILGILFVVPRIGYEISRTTTGVYIRAPFWMLLVAVAGGQLLFNRKLSNGWRLLLAACIGAGAVYALYWNRESASTWVGMAAALGVLAWLRWPRLRWIVIILLVVMVSTGTLFSAVYDFAGGDEEWERTGVSRIALISRVAEVTMRNPITGLGPAAYRPYANVKPLYSNRVVYSDPDVSSHNNYVDLFSHVGVVGVGLFAWFAAEYALLGLRLKSYFVEGFAAGYVNSMLAVGAGALTLMMFADWILPFVYNIGFPGFQASVLVWAFMGGLVTLEQIMLKEKEIGD